jgi:hypothetical protein
MIWKLDHFLYLTLVVFCIPYLICMYSFALFIYNSFFYNSFFYMTGHFYYALLSLMLSSYYYLLQLTNVRSHPSALAPNHRIPDSRLHRPSRDITHHPYHFCSQPHDPHSHGCINPPNSSFQLLTHLSTPHLRSVISKPKL